MTEADYWALPCPPGFDPDRWIDAINNACNFGCDWLEHLMDEVGGNIVGAQVLALSKAHRQAVKEQSVLRAALDAAREKHEEFYQGGYGDGFCDGKNEGMKGAPR